MKKYLFIPVAIFVYLLLLGIGGFIGDIANNKSNSDDDRIIYTILTAFITFFLAPFLYMETGLKLGAKSIKTSKLLVISFCIVAAILVLYIFAVSISNSLGIYIIGFFLLNGFVILYIKKKKEDKMIKEIIQIYKEDGIEDVVIIKSLKLLGFSSDVIKASLNNNFSE